MADVTFLDVRRLTADVEAEAADVALAMDEDAFRAFYDRTSGALWGYLSRISGDRQVADDLLQESYYRLLKSNAVFESENHRRNYLYRIATNLVRDSRRSPRPYPQSPQPRPPRNQACLLKPRCCRPPR